MSEMVDEAHQNLAELAENPYPGRGLVMGLNSLGDTALQAYWVMGRSDNSRNRVLVLQEDNVVKTEAYDASKVTDPSLIIYNAMRAKGDCHVVSNGDQTDTIMDGLESGIPFEVALRGRSYEPDAPNFTPRISGLLVPRDFTSGAHVDCKLSVIRRDDSDGRSRHLEYHDILSQSDAGTGLSVHTSLGDGSPLPPFDKAPFKLPLGESAEDTAETLWANLDGDNRVAIAVKGIHIATNAINYRIINAHETAG